MYKIDDYHCLKRNTSVITLIGVTIILLIIIMNKKILINKTFITSDEKLKDRTYTKIKVNGKKQKDLLIKEKKAIVELEYQDKLFTFIKEYIGERYDRNKRRRNDEH